MLDRVTAVMTLRRGARRVRRWTASARTSSRPSRRSASGSPSAARAAGPLDRVLRRLLGIEQKMQQYADGRIFVGGVVDRVGMDGFNRVWESPETLPRIEEITDPAPWVARVLGRPAIPA